MNDRDSVNEGAEDGELRAAFAELRTSAARLDSFAARRRLEGAGRGTRRLAPGLAIAAAVLVAALGLGYAATRGGESQDVVTEPPDGSGTTEDGVPGTGVAATDPLDGTSWRLVSGVPLVEGWPITITFGGGSVGGTAACNGIGAGYRLEGSGLPDGGLPDGGLSDGELSFGELDTTTRSCEAPVMDSEASFLDAARRVDSYRLAGDRLTLAGPDVELVFARLDSLDVSSVVGLTWILDSYTSGGTVAEAAGNGGFLRLDPDGTLAGGTGCRSLSGQWIVSGPEVQFTSFATEGECGPDLADQDDRVVTVLEGGFTIEVEASRLTVTSRDNGSLAYRLAADGEEPDRPVAEGEADFAFDPSLTWAVILVEDDDVLNVRAAPGAANAKVAELGPGQTGIVAGTEVVDVDGGLWRQVRTGGSAVGWVNDAYLAASPVTFDDAARSAMVGTAESAVAWLTGRTDAGQPSEWLSPTGLWIGGIGVYADLPFPSRRVPAADLANQQGWTTPIDFTPPAATAVACGSECVISPLDFVKLPDPDRSYELVVDEVLLAEGQAESVAGTVFHNGAVGPLEAMHHVTVDVPATDESLLDWQRIHLFFDWRTGEPRLHAAYTWGWTP